MQALIRAVIDLGSNSIKCVVAQGVGSECRIIREFSQVTRLGEELERSGKIGAKSSERNLEFLAGIRSACLELGVREILCVGAETLRRAKDATGFAEQLLHRTGWKLRVLSPDEEAELSFAAAADLAPNAEPFMVLDSGGGSTEFSFGQEQRLLASHSLPLGALTLTRGHVHSDPAAPGELRGLRRHIRNLLTEAFPRPERQFTIACGGGVNSLAAVALVLEPYDASLVQGFWLSQAELKRQIRLYSLAREAERARIKGLPPGREGTVLASALILEGIREHFVLESVSVSSHGIRHALLAEKHLGLFQSFV